MRSFPCCANSGQYADDPLFVVEPPSRVGHREGHRGQALGGRVDDHHGVLLPRLARPPVANTTPQVDDLLASVVHAAGAAEFVASSEVVVKGLAHGLKPRTDVSLYGV